MCVSVCMNFCVYVCVCVYVSVCVFGSMYMCVCVREYELVPVLVFVLIDSHIMYKCNKYTSIHTFVLSFTPQLTLSHSRALSLLV